MAQLRRRIIAPNDGPKPIGAYSHAIEVPGNRLLFVAGQIALDADGNLVGAGDVKAQTRQVYENIDKVLASAGASFSNVVEFTTYLVGRQSVQPFTEVRSEVFPRIFPNGEYPANTLLIINGLVREEFLVEIKAVAALG